MFSLVYNHLKIRIVVFLLTYCSGSQSGGGAPLQVIARGGKAFDDMIYLGGINKQEFVSSIMLTFTKILFCFTIIIMKGDMKEKVLEPVP